MSQTERSNTTLSELRKFLLIRGVDEEAIQCMEDAKIDLEVLSIITDDKLKTYLPQYGDRIAVVSFARRNIEKTRHTETGTAADRRRLLAETLKTKMSSRHFTRSKKQVGNIHAKKQDRRVEVGWVDFNDELKEYKQVKAPSGGGTKHATFSLESSLAVVLDQAKHWFFPNGESRRGLVSQFDLFITDTMQIPIDEKLTVGEMYDRQKAKILRLYIASKKKGDTSSSQGLESTSQKEDSNSFRSVEAISQNSIDMPEMKKPKRRKMTCSPSTPKLPATPDAEEPVTKVRVESREDIAASLFPVNEHDPANYQMLLDEDGTCSLLLLQEPLTSPNNGQTYDTTNMDTCMPTMHLMDPAEPANQYTELQQPNDGGDNISIEQTTHSQPAVQPAEDTCMSLSPTPTMDNSANANGKPIVMLHRANIINEMICFFVDPGIIDTDVLFKFDNEAAADAFGVSREAYSAFWEEFYLAHTSGEAERVPALSPEFGLAEWSAVGRILAKGYKDHGLLPSRLSPAFLIAVVHSEHAVSPEMLISSYKAYLSQLDADVISKAISGSMDETDKDDLLDILGRADCHIVPDADTMVETIRNAAHKELIQEPSYALDAMTVAARTTLLPLMPTVEEVLNVYEVRKPNPRKVINLIQSNPNNVSQEKVLGYLKQYVRGLDSKTLKKFLRFCTGSETLCFGKLMVEFNSVKRGAGRFPIAHTCGPLLELPDSYASYNELRAELSCILDSGYLRMDVV